MPSKTVIFRSKSKTVNNRSKTEVPGGLIPHCGTNPPGLEGSKTVNLRSKTVKPHPFLPPGVVQTLEKPFQNGESCKIEGFCRAQPERNNQPTLLCDSKEPQK